MGEVLAGPGRVAAGRCPELATPAPRRHDRVWLGPRWAEALAAPLAAPLRTVLDGWLAAGRPLVASRRDPALPGAVALGLARPPGAAVRRLALAVDPAAVSRIAPPLALRVALRSAPPPWRERLSRLDAAARHAGVVLRVHGSLAWQHLSGEPYVTGSSDVDLVVRVRDLGRIGPVLALLGEAARDGAPRLDGEVILPGERGVAWRELAAGAERLLVKSGTGVVLMTREEMGLGAESRPRAAGQDQDQDQDQDQR